MRALVFDVDGTMADTEAVHREAFNAAFAEAGLDWHWDEALYARLLKVAGGKERIRHYWRCVEPEEAAGGKSRDVVDAIHAIKTRRYTERVRGGGVPLRPGIRRLIDEGHAAGMPLAIATTTTPANIDALLSGPLGAGWRERFAAVCDASTVLVKKPAPDVYIAVLRQLGLPAADCLALEDSEIGLRAARTAGIPVVVTPTAYTAAQNFDEALVVLPHLGDPGVPVRRTGAEPEHDCVDLESLRRIHLRQDVR
ncbi:HAD family hydrolase [Burkholderia anthina]|uniref:HAD family hydrolase n=1 Tax=Burkholderia anthina TaxID=179879 RepID=UPI001AA02FDD|nr:HAD family hydrolase [Burkholderia anthina]QTD95274.1 HAD family hydrolase [Burkholderia anthina]